MGLRFRWVVRGVLAGMERPGSYHTIEQDIALLLAEGIGQVLTLTERPLDGEPFERAGIAVRHVPIEDFDAPTDAQAMEIVSLVDRSAVEGRATLVHCLAGLGRTGTIAACYLAHRNRWDGISALRAAREIEPGYVQSPSQEDFVVSFAAEHAP